MRRRCGLTYCKNKGPIHGIHYYRLPSNERLRKEWCKWIGIQNNIKYETILNLNLFVCSRHFTDEEKGNKKLRSGAVPSIACNVSKQSCPQADALSYISDCISDQDRSQYSVVVCIELKNNTLQAHTIQVNDEKDSVVHKNNFYLKYSSITEVDRNDHGKDGNSDSIKQEVHHIQYTDKNFNTLNCICVDWQSTKNHPEDEHSLKDINNNAETSTLEKQTQYLGTGSIKRKCCALNCQNNNLTATLFTFPGIYTTIDTGKVMDPIKLQRCRKWVANSGNTELLKVNPSFLQNHFYICQEHFTVSEFNNKMSSCLKRNAVPTVFTCNSIASAQMEMYDSTWSSLRSEEVTFHFTDISQDNSQILAELNMPLKDFQQVCFTIPLWFHNILVFSPVYYHILETMESGKPPLLKCNKQLQCNKELKILSRNIYTLLF